MQLKNLKTKFLAHNCIYYKTIDSTQSKVWKMLEQNAPNGSLVIADIQTAGKGTHGRIWHTDEKNNIAFSFFIKLECDIKKLDGITLETAKIIVNIFKEKYNINLCIKEPNDLVINNKKVGGILTETKVLSGKVQYLVVGIGINTSKKYFTEDIKDLATSIKKEFNIDVNTKKFIAEFCNKFEKEILERIGDEN